MSALALRFREAAWPALPRDRERIASGLGGLAGLALIAALLPLRGSWAVAVVLVGLVFTVPGVLALRAIRVSEEAVVSYPLYIPAAALFVVMAGGLAGDLLGPMLGAAKPLQGDTVAVATLAISLVLWLIGLARSDAARVPWRTLFARPSLLAPLALPALAAAGALLLTNGHGSSVAKLAAILTPCGLLLCLAFANHLTRAHVAVLLFACSLAAEWAFSIRSQEIVGFDISTEIHIAQHTEALGIWRSVHHNDAYGAMLSITVLPSALAALTGCSPLIAFKVLFPVLAALLPVSVFLVAERFMRRPFAAGAAALIVVQSYFFQLMPQLARQEIGLVFFAVLVAALLDARLRRGPRLAIVAAMAAGLIVSHYSSAYLAIPTIVIALVAQAVLDSGLRRLPRPSAPLLCAAIVLVGGAGIWYGAVTHSSSNLTSFSSALEKKGLDLLPNQKGNIVATYLGGNEISSVSGPRFERLAVRDYHDKASYIVPFASAHEQRYQLRSATVPAPPVRVPAAISLLKLLTIAVGQLLLAFGVIGAIAMTLDRGRRDRARPNRSVRHVGVLALATVGVLALVRFSGTAAAAYNQQRALLQSLILLSLPAAWLAQRFVGRLRAAGPPVAIAMALGLSLLFAYQSGATSALTGGPTSLNLAQSGEDFEREYTTPAELAGARWASNESQRAILYADRYGQLRLFESTGRVALTELTPLTLDHYGWVYGTRTNTVLGRARGQVGNFASTYQWPRAFLNWHFNTVYTNGESEVFHG